MDRQEFLKELEQLVSVNNLDSDEIRLYILLLTNCLGTRTGKIGYGTIKSAMGSEFSPGKLHNACQRLSSSKLIKLTSSSPLGTSDEDFTLTYMIIPAKSN
jgi:hypothetical protein